MEIKIHTKETGTRYEFKKMYDFTGDFEALREFVKCQVDEIWIEARRLQDEANAVPETGGKDEAQSKKG